MRTPTIFLALAATLAGAAPATAADPIPFDLTTLPQPLLSYSGAAHGASSNEEAGKALAGGCDLNGDGYDDGLAATSTFVSAGERVPGRVYVVFGGPVATGGDLGSLASAGAAAIDGAIGNADNGGVSLTLACAGRVDDDAIDDALIGVEDYDGAAGENSGAAWVVFGDGDLAPGDTIDLGEAGTGFRIDAAAANHRLGHTVDGVGDIDGDGNDDLAVGTYDPTVGTPGVAYVVAGKDGGGAVDLGTAGSALLEIAGSGGGSLSAIAGAGDADGDGVPDVVVNDPYMSFGAASVAGISYVVSGDARGELNLGTAAVSDDAILFRAGGGEFWLSGFNVAAAGDVNGDDRGDVLLSGEFHPSGARAFVVFGSAAHDDVDLAALGARGFEVTAPAGTTALGTAGTMAATGDVDGDGLDDLAFSDPDPAPDAADLHAAFLVYGKTGTAAVELASLTQAAGARLVGPAQAGPITVAGLGDFDANGQRDLLVGAPSQSAPGGATNAGRVTAVRIGTPPLPADVAFEAGRLDWGVKQSFRNYVTGPIAHGDIATSGGAVVNPDGTFGFPFVAGEYTTATGDASVELAGKVRFRGHETAPGSGSHLLQLEISDIHVTIAGDAGTLRADVASKALSDGSTVEYPDVELAELDLSGVDAVADGSEVTWSGVPATLTEAGAPAFGGFYTGGTSIDPLTLTGSTDPEWGGGLDPAPDPDPDPRPDPQPGPGPAPDPKPKPSPPAFKAPSIAPLAKPQRLSKRRLATVARLTCRSGPCRIGTPKKLRVRIAGKTYRVAVIAPRKLSAGARGLVRVKLPKPAARALAGHKLKLRISIVVRSNGQRIARTARATLVAR